MTLFKIIIKITIMTITMIIIIMIKTNIFFKNFINLFSEIIKTFDTH